MSFVDDGEWKSIRRIVHVNHRGYLSFARSRTRDSLRTIWNLSMELHRRRWNEDCLADSTSRAGRGVSPASIGARPAVPASASKSVCFARERRPRCSVILNLWETAKECRAKPRSCYCCHRILRRCSHRLPWSQTSTGPANPAAWYQCFSHVNKTLLLNLLYLICVILRRLKLPFSTEPVSNTPVSNIPFCSSKRWKRKLKMYEKN